MIESNHNSETKNKQHAENVALLSDLHESRIRYSVSLNGALLSLSTYNPESPSSRKPAKQKTRGNVTAFSVKSRAAILRYTRGVPKDRYKSMLTLTYKTAPTAKESKIHLDRLLKELERNALESKNKKPFSALWCMEYQERGVIHFHVWSSHYADKKKLREKWNRITGQAGNPSTDVRGWQAKSRSGLSAYVCKYAAKQEQKELPEDLKEEGAGRWWGVRGDKTTPLRIKKRIKKQDFYRTLDAVISFGYRQLDCEFARVFIVDDEDIENFYNYIENLEEIT